MLEVRQEGRGVHADELSRAVELVPATRAQIAAIRSAVHEGGVGWSAPKVLATDRCRDARILSEELAPTRLTLEPFVEPSAGNELWQLCLHARQCGLRHFLRLA